MRPAGLKRGSEGTGQRFTHWGNIWVILGLHWDNGKENGNDHLGFKGFRV